MATDAPPWQGFASLLLGSCLERVWWHMRRQVEMQAIERRVKVARS